MPIHVKISLVLVALLLMPVHLEAAPVEYDLFARTNLMAWCIVPFDAKKRGPEERAEMLHKLGIQGLAYDYRAEHIPTFDAEIAALKRRQIELTAWWFPTTLNAEAQDILKVLKRSRMSPQLWVMGGGEPKNDTDHAARVDQEVLRLRPIADAAAEISSKVGLYNHGGWFGEPTNQLAIIKRLHLLNVGIVYNLHHAHDQLDRFPALLKAMKPYLLAINLNGMVENGDKTRKKILPIGQGTRDLEILRIIEKSDWRGPIGILNHTEEDAEARLQDNIEGLEWLVAQLRGRDPGPKPKPRSWQP